MKTKDKVIFRKDKDGTIFALFPCIPADARGFFCQTYQHVGQHSSADYSGCVRNSKPAKPAEFKELAKELRGRGYNLQIIHRAPSNAYAVRRELINRL